jgi:hypothetical protein
VAGQRSQAPRLGKAPGAQPGVHARAPGALKEPSGQATHVAAPAAGTKVFSGHSAGSAEAGPQKEPGGQGWHEALEAARTPADQVPAGQGDARVAAAGQKWPGGHSLHTPGEAAPVALATADIATLVAECEIDHGVGPVAHTRGGSRAGYARWEEFTRSGRLAKYAAKRNDATIDGVRVRRPLRKR